MFEVIRWISIFLMWVAVGMNLYAMVRCLRTEKKLHRLEECYTNAIETYNTSREAYEALRDRLLNKEVPDERQD